MGVAKRPRLRWLYTTSGRRPWGLCIEPAGAVRCIGRKASHGLEGWRVCSLRYTPRKPDAVLGLGLGLGLGFTIGLGLGLGLGFGLGLGLGLGFGFGSP